jgi:hypothetical protein
MKYYNFDHHQNIMDIGGNSGEFVLQICRKYHSIRAVAFDLPLVCGIGREHIHREPEADRISFIEGNALTDTLPGGFDLITFKSMLHDWPETEAVHFITNASKALVPGGTLLIFERGPMEIDSGNLSFSIIPMFLFYHSFRLPEIYERHLQKIGFQEIAVKWINLESPFFLVTARKKM